ncbi:hypothetical protein B0T18DRAFT_394373 [Schizothecium vesticola]|uniref:Uncharacterized protein n=1 Tax=Schizothecium vesticola TaxID=314040 RepID=A0AA40BPM6_9PEZI|nr:hypothetical protein B0T18DRAFT_394373 [Schizothecium vesticola]
MDKLCHACDKLELTTRRFEVLPGDDEWGKPSGRIGPPIPLGTVEDLLTRTRCPMCRLVVAALGGENKVPTHSASGESLRVTVGWDTHGTAPDAKESWVHLPQSRVLIPKVVKASGMITLLANDAPPTTTSTTYLVRPIAKDRIDFGLVRRWLALCNTHHGEACHRYSILKKLGRSNAAECVPDFRCIDVERNCLAGLCIFDSLKAGQVEKAHCVNKAH